MFRRLLINSTTTMRARMRTPAMAPRTPATIVVVVSLCLELVDGAVVVIVVGLGVAVVVVVVELGLVVLLSEVED